MNGTAFIQWYLDQLCKHPVEACRIAPHRIFCGHCQVSLPVTQRTLELYRGYYSVPEDLA